LQRSWNWNAAVWYEGGLWHIRECVDSMLEMCPQEEADHHVYDIMADMIEGWLMHVGMMPLFHLVDWMIAELGAEGERAWAVQQTILAVLIARRAAPVFAPMPIIICGLSTRMWRPRMHCCSADGAWYCGPGLSGVRGSAKKDKPCCGKRLN